MRECIETLEEASPEEASAALYNLSRTTITQMVPTADLKELMGRIVAESVRCETLIHFEVLVMAMDYVLTARPDAVATRKIRKALDDSNSETFTWRMLVMARGDTATVKAPGMAVLARLMECNHKPLLKAVERNRDLLPWCLAQYAEPWGGAAFAVVAALVHTRGVERAAATMGRRTLCHHWACAIVRGTEPALRLVATIGGSASQEIIRAGPVGRLLVTLGGELFALRDVPRGWWFVPRY